MNNPRGEDDAPLERRSAWRAVLAFLFVDVVRRVLRARRRGRRRLSARSRAHPRPVGDRAAADAAPRKPYMFHAGVFKAERLRIRNRREIISGKRERGPSSPAETVGLALSGGGIRSATFSMGVVQWLARKDLLQKVDYLSTVSGGGYTGCFLGSHFLPEDLRQGRECHSHRQFRDQCHAAYEELKKAATPTPPSEACAGVRSTLIQDSGQAPTAGEAHWSGGKAFEWLRNNGRYLAPRGTGDLLYVVAMQIRNWVAVQYVIGVMILFLLLIFSTGRAWMLASWPLWQRIETQFLPEPGAAIYWSPGWVLVGVFGVLTLLPPALAFWLAHSRVDRKRELSWLPLWHEGVIIFLLLLGLTWAWSVLVVLPGDSPSDLPKVFWAAAVWIFISLVAIVTFLAALDVESRGRKACIIDLSAALAAVILLLVLALPDLRASGQWWWWLAGVIVLVVLVMASIRLGRGKKPDLKSLRTRLTLLLGSTFWIFLGSAGLALLGSIGQTAYAYVRLEPGVGRVAGVTSLIAALVAGARQLFKWLGSGTEQAHPRIPFGALAGAAAVLLLLLTGGAWATLVQAALWKGGPPLATPVSPHPDSVRTWRHAQFVNVAPWGRDTARVIRLELEDTALVQRRQAGIAPGWMTVLFGGATFLFVTTGMFLNFINMSSLHQFYAARLGRAYLGATNRDRFKRKVITVTTPLPTDTIRLDAYYHRHVAAPVHLINVTVNQTRPPHDQLVQRDRKGMSMAIGPEYTVVNSAVFRRDDSTGNLKPCNQEAAALAGNRRRQFDSEELDLGDWCAVSGAAFSTGLGMRTSLGLSLLAGLANVRLGYWWNFNTERRALGWLPAYRYLWAELMADFKGPWKPYWFLTDGGHFDNTAVYELVRRRVGTIVLCDNGCDPEYRFEDLGNLARKVRTDFDAELRPIIPTETTPKCFGTAEDFADPDRRKGKCALLYEIRYPRDPERPAPGLGTLLIVLKPSMIPGVPIDVAEYGNTNQAFPHQTTLDQFFDDAQWESYRKLGETIAETVLNEDALRVDGWRKTLLARPREVTGAG